MSLLSDNEILKLLQNIEDTSNNLRFEECAGILEINNGKLCLPENFEIKN